MLQKVNISSRRVKRRLPFQHLRPHLLGRSHAIFLTTIIVIAITSGIHTPVFALAFASSHQLSSHGNSMITIERVSTKQRALDVFVYRGFQMSCEEYIKKQQQRQQQVEVQANNDNVIITEEEALNVLMKGYDDNGDYINHASPHDRQVYFAAIYNADKYKKGGDNQDYGSYEYDELDKIFARQNGIVGVVSAQVRNRNKKNRKRKRENDDGENAHANANAKTSPQDDGNRSRNPKLDLDDLPRHVYLANMSVDDNMRRKGIGTLLLNAVSDYARSIAVSAETNHGTRNDDNNKDNDSDVLPLVVLSVDDENVGAIKFYQQHGYQYFDKRSMYLDSFGMV